jgi:hypothetical protein
LIDLRLLRAAGYRVTLVVVTTADPEINVARVERRVLAGGHHVPADRVRDRYHRFMRFLPCAVELAEDTWIMDASARITPCLRIKRGRLFGDAVPLYLQTNLVMPLVGRADDRASLSDLVEPGSQLIAANDQDGLYEGPMVAVLPTAALQRTTQGDFVCHDLVLQTQPLQLGQLAIIRYDQGYGVPAF